MKSEDLREEDAELLFLGNELRASALGDPERHEAVEFGRIPRYTEPGVAWMHKYPHVYRCNTDFLAVCAILLYVQSASPLVYPYILSIRYREKAWSGVRVHVSILSVHVVFTPPLRGLVY